MRASLLVLALLVLPGLSRAQRQVGGKISDLKSKILDLNFRVQDTSGKVQDLDIKETPTEVRIELAADVLFDFDKADLLPNARQTLEKAAQIIRDRAKGEVRIEGYTDAKGSDAYNQKLSERRAQSVRNWLAANGADLKMSTRGWGEKKPVAPNTKSDGKDDPEGRQKNRRVEITVKSQ